MTTLNPKPRGRRPKTTFEPVQIGIKKIAADATKLIFKRAFERKLLLKIPQEILDNNPNKHFVWVNMPRLQNAGFYHPEGYRLYKAEDVEIGSPDEKLTIQFMKGADGFIHRNEMVLAYLSKEEHEQRVFEEQVIRGKTKLEDVIEKNPNLYSSNPKQSFVPHAAKEVEVKQFTNTEEVANG